MRVLYSAACAEGLTVIGLITGAWGRGPVTRLELGTGNPGRTAAFPTQREHRLHVEHALRYFSPLVSLIV